MEIASLLYLLQAVLYPRIYLVWFFYSSSLFPNKGYYVAWLSAVVL